MYNLSNIHSIQAGLNFMLVPPTQYKSKQN
jgi:hypothetical protein